MKENMKPQSTQRKNQFSHVSKKFFSNENIAEKIDKYRINFRKSIHHRGHRVDRDKLKRKI